MVDIDLLPRENGDDKADALGKESGGKIIIVGEDDTSNALCKRTDARLVVLRRRREESIVLSSTFTYVLSITTDALFCADVALRTFRVLLEFSFDSDSKFTYSILSLTDDDALCCADVALLILFD